MSENIDRLLRPYDDVIREQQDEIERLRAAYDDAVSRQKARRDATIEECAQAAEEWLRKGGSLRDLMAAIRALKDKP